MKDAIDKRILYKANDGGVAVIVPNPECHLTLKQIASKDVPAGSPYKIIDASLLKDRSYRNAWDIDDADLDTGIGGPEGIKQ